MHQPEPQLPEMDGGKAWFIDTKVIKDPVTQAKEMDRFNYRLLHNKVQALGGVPITRTWYTVFNVVDVHLSTNLQKTQVNLPFFFHNASSTPYRYVECGCSRREGRDFVYHLPLCASHASEQGHQGKESDCARDIQC